MLLTDEGKKEFLKSNFHPYFDISLSTNIKKENINSFVDITIPLEKLDNFYDLNNLSAYFNDEYNNIIFTSSDNNSIFRYEIYQNVYFIRMEPFSSVIRAHIIPKKYDASNTKSNAPLLFFKENKQNIEEAFSCTNQYERKEDGNPINLYYKNENKVSSNGIYKFDIKKYAKDLKRLQINLGYSYNDTNPTEEINHLTGILDESDQYGKKINNLTEWNIALMDANYDNISSFTNVAKPQRLQNNKITWPNNTTPYPNNSVGFNNEHSINQKYHKTIKYFNDDIYIEENENFINANWDEELIRG